VLNTSESELRHTESMVSAYCTVHAGWDVSVSVTVDDAMDFPGKSQAGEASLSLVPFTSLSASERSLIDSPTRREVS
jgi:hypothetical protein